MAVCLERLDSIIQSLSSVLDLVDEFQRYADQEGRGKDVSYRATSSFASLAERKNRSATLHGIEGKIISLHTRDHLARKTDIEISIQARKNGDGELILKAKSTITSSERIAGGVYLTQCELTDIGREDIPITERLMECVLASDPMRWNRWCADLSSGANLQQIDLQDASLAHFDFCCANLTGANLSNADLSHAVLSGADLTDTTLDGVQSVGADFYRARMPHEYAALVQTSGMVETESVIFVGQDNVLAPAESED